MTNPLKRRSGGIAGGFLIALGMLLGAVIGTVYRQPSIGFLAGLGIGILLSLLIWWLDRRRT
jgi:hypothetical protein